jgi:dihydrolipoamide dehydrogenase
VAIVGHRVSQLDPKKTIVGEASFEHQGRARLMLRNVGAIRVYADHEDGRILGAEICAPGGEHLAHFLALAIHRRSTVLELLRAPFYHPSLEEGLRTALRDAAKHLPTADAFELA